MATGKSRPKKLRNRFSRTRAIKLFLRVFYRYRIEGQENIPDGGPIIVLYNEPSLLTTMLEWVANTTFLRPLLSGEAMYFVGEELWSMEYFRDKFGHSITSQPSLPHGAGMLGMSLIEALRVLERGGAFVTNPDGDMARDGRPVPMRGGAAWVGLHSAAPMLPVIPSVGAYDAWPPWQMLPNLGGELRQRIGKPFKVTETPLIKVTDKDVAKANARIAAEIERLSYGPGGVAEWAGLPTKNGRPLEEPIDLRSVGEGVSVAEIPPLSAPAEEDTGVTSLWRRGLPLLLWRCPVCLTDDALVHRRRRFRSQSVYCQACGTRWLLRRKKAKDYRLEVVAGPAELLGLDMALTNWYDEMKRDFQPSAIPASDLDLAPGEEVYLRTDGVKLIAYRSNLLYEGWTGREPPRDSILRRSEAGLFDAVGMGKLFMTDRRLVWEGDGGGLDFWWSQVTDVNLRLFFALRVNYGLTPYRFQFMQDSGLKWLTYAASVVQKVAAQEGRKVTLSPF